MQRIGCDKTKGLCASPEIPSAACWEIPSFGFKPLSRIGFCWDPPLSALFEQSQTMLYLCLYSSCLAPMMLLLAHFNHQFFGYRWNLLIILLILQSSQTCDVPTPLLLDTGLMPRNHQLLNGSPKVQDLPSRARPHSAPYWSTPWSLAPKEIQLKRVDDQ